MYFNQIGVIIYLMYPLQVKTLQAKITKQAYYRTHFTQYSKTFHNSKPAMFFPKIVESQSTLMY